MIIKSLLDEDFVNYKKPSMIIGFPKCDFKCDRGCGQQVCQNSALATAPNIEIDDDRLIQRYLNNGMVKSICCQGLEPLDTIFQLGLFIVEFREKSDDDIVIYTGYNKCEVENEIKYLAYCAKKNLIVKFGRYVPGQQPHYDEVLGVNLASDNQYAERIN